MCAERGDERTSFTRVHALGRAEIIAAGAAHVPRAQRYLAFQLAGVEAILIIVLNMRMLFAARACAGAGASLLAFALIQFALNAEFGLPQLIQFEAKLVLMRNERTEWGVAENLKQMEE
jgi:hypothetical protein